MPTEDKMSLKLHQLEGKEITVWVDGEWFCGEVMPLVTFSGLFQLKIKEELYTIRIDRVGVISEPLPEGYHGKSD